MRSRDSLHIFLFSNANGPTLRSYPRTTFCLLTREIMLFIGQLKGRLKRILFTTCERAHYISPHELVVSCMSGRSAQKSQKRRGPLSPVISPPHRLYTSEIPMLKSVSSLNKPTRDVPATGRSIWQLLLVLKICMRTKMRSRALRFPQRKDLCSIPQSHGLVCLW